MSVLLFLLIIVIFLFIKGLKNNTIKNSNLLKELGLFAFVFGVLGFVIGLRGALIAISMANDVAPQVLAGGFSIGLIPPVFGLIIYLIAKLLTIILAFKREEK